MGSLQQLDKLIWVTFKSMTTLGLKTALEALVSKHKTPVVGFKNLGKIEDKQDSLMLRSILPRSILQEFLNRLLSCQLRTKPPSKLTSWPSSQTIFLLLKEGIARKRQKSQRSGHYRITITLGFILLGNLTLKNGTD